MRLPFIEVAAFPFPATERSESHDRPADSDRASVDRSSHRHGAGHSSLAGALERVERWEQHRSEERAPLLTKLAEAVGVKPSRGFLLPPVQDRDTRGRSANTYRAKPCVIRNRNKEASEAPI